MVKINTVREKVGRYDLLLKLEKEIDSRIVSLNNIIEIPNPSYNSLSKEETAVVFNTLRDKYIDSGGWGCHWVCKSKSQVTNMETYSVNYIEFCLYAPEKAV